MAALEVKKCRRSSQGRDLPRLGGTLLDADLNHVCIEKVSSAQLLTSLGIAAPSGYPGMSHEVLPGELVWAVAFTAAHVLSYY